MAAASNVLDTMGSQIVHHRFTVEAYDAMIDHGILTSRDRVELLAGEIVEKVSPIGHRHISSVMYLTQFFAMNLAGRALASPQLPLVLPPDSEPEPDFAVLTHRDDMYKLAKPRAGDAYLVVEVADSSLFADRTIKLPLYDAAGIREYWIVDLTHDAIEVYTDPTEHRYATKRIVHVGDALAPQAFPALTIDTAGLLAK
jgi:Uma2 family endonuclease